VGAFRKSVWKIALYRSLSVCILDYHIKVINIGPLKRVARLLAALALYQLGQGLFFVLGRIQIGCPAERVWPPGRFLPRCRF
jgi:hypothetical protein